MGNCDLTFNDRVYANMLRRKGYGIILIQPAAIGQFLDQATARPKLKGSLAGVGNPLFLRFHASLSRSHGHLLQEPGFQRIGQALRNRSIDHETMIRTFKDFIGEILVVFAVSSTQSQ